MHFFGMLLQTGTRATLTSAHEITLIALIILTRCYFFKRGIEMFDCLGTYPSNEASRLKAHDDKFHK